MKRWGLAVVALVIAGWVLSSVLSPQEPRIYYNGKRVSYWVHQHTRRHAVLPVTAPDATLKTVLDIGAEATVQPLLRERSFQSSLRLPLLFSIRGYSDNDVHINAALAISKLGSSAIPILKGFATSEDTSLRMNVPESLASYANQDSEILPLIIRMLDDQKFTVRSSAVDALGSIGPSAKPAVPALEKILNEQPAFILPWLSARALAKIDPSSRALRTTLSNWSNASTLPGVNAKTVRFLNLDAASLLSTVTAPSVPVAKP